MFLNKFSELMRRSAIVLMLLIFLGCVQQQPTKITEEEARSFVNDDLRAKYPNAEVREVIQISFDGESWQVKTRVTFNYSTPCPVRMHVYYDYPRRGFVVAPPEYITKECVICKEAICVIGTPEEAIIASHTLNGTGSIKEYVDRHADAVPDSKFYSEYFDKDAGTKYKNVWVVKWLSKSTNYGIILVISGNGEIVKIWEVAKEEVI